MIDLSAASPFGFLFDSRYGVAPLAKRPFNTSLQYVAFVFEMKIETGLLKSNTRGDLIHTGCIKTSFAKDLGCSDQHLLLLRIKGGSPPPIESLVLCSPSFYGFSLIHQFRLPILPMLLLSITRRVRDKHKRSSYGSIDSIRAIRLLVFRSTSATNEACVVVRKGAPMTDTPENHVVAALVTEIRDNGRNRQYRESS